MKTITSNNFFKHTFCEFQKVELAFFSENKFHFKSKANSQYFYTDKGVYRYSNHWGRVANCRWRLLSDEKIKNQNYYIGFAKWINFYPLNEAEKQFYISVDFENKMVDFYHNPTKENVFLFFAETAQKKVIQIRKILSEDKWATYFDVDIEFLRKKIIKEYINSNKTLQQLKLELRSNDGVIFSTKLLPPEKIDNSNSSDILIRTLYFTVRRFNYFFLTLHLGSHY